MIKALLLKCSRCDGIHYEYKEEKILLNCSYCNGKYSLENTNKYVYLDEAANSMYIKFESEYKEVLKAIEFIVLIAAHIEILISKVKKIDLNDAYELTESLKTTKGGF